MEMSDFLFQNHHKRKNAIVYVYFVKKKFQSGFALREVCLYSIVHICDTFRPFFIGISMACCKVHFHYYYYILRQLKSISNDQFDNKHLRFSWPDKNYIIGNLRQMVQ